MNHVFEKPKPARSLNLLINIDSKTNNWESTHCGRSWAGRLGLFLLPSARGRLPEKRRLGMQISMYKKCEIA